MTCIRIPSGWRFYPLNLIGNVAYAMANGIAAPRDNPQGVWLEPYHFARARKMVDPRVAAHIARQMPKGGCCGD